MIKKETVVNGKKIKKIIEYYPSEEKVEELRSRATLIMLKHRLESLSHDKNNK